MPIYEYKCPACGTAFEQLVRSQGEEEGVACPQCGGRGVEKQMSVISTPRVDTRAAARSSPCQQCSAPGGSCPYK